MFALISEYLFSVTGLHSCVKLGQILLRLAKSTIHSVAKRKHRASENTSKDEWFSLIDDPYLTPRAHYLSEVTS